MASNCTQWGIIHYYHYLCWCSDCPRVGQWELLWAGFCACPLSTSYFQYKTVKAYSPSLTHGLSHFAKGPWFFSVGSNIGTPNLGGRCTHCKWGVIGYVLSEDRWENSQFISFLPSPFYICSSQQNQYIYSFAQFYNTHKLVSELLHPHNY